MTTTLRFRPIAFAICCLLSMAGASQAVATVEYEVHYYTPSGEGFCSSWARTYDPKKPGDADRAKKACEAGGKGCVAKVFRGSALPGC